MDIMTYTSAQASKLLRKLNDQYTLLLQKEEQSSTFLAAMGEDVESVRPPYDYAATQAQLEKLEEQIRIVKHAINLFNTTHTVPGFDMTIDQMLVYIPQLTQKRAKLHRMQGRLAKSREPVSAYTRGGNIIDYWYTNYDVQVAEADFAAVCEQLAKAQTALDLVNNTETMEINL